MSSTYITESLADGLVKRYLKEHGDRLKGRIYSLEDQRTVDTCMRKVFRGIPPRKRKKHTEALIKTLSKYRIVIPDFGISHITSEPLDDVSLYIIGINRDELRFDVNQLHILYNKKMCAVPKKLTNTDWVTGGHTLFHLDGLHVVSRFVQRTQCTDIPHALKILCGGIPQATWMVDEPNAVGKANIPLEHGGMLLGEVGYENGERTYYARTYISPDLVAPHNMEHIHMNHIAKRIIDNWDDLKQQRELQKKQAIEHRRAKQQGDGDK